MTKTFAQLNFPGRLIAVEGLDGSGKSTQIYLLKRWLELQGLKVFFSEWNSSELVKSATSKGKKRELLTPTTFSLIHATDFADRYERRSLLVTSNLAFSEWSQVFQGERMTAALLDRLTHRCQIFEMNSESFRFRESMKNKKGKKSE